MSGNSSGSDYPGGGSSPEEIKPSVPEAGEGTEGKIDNACNSQAHSTTHCTQSETNQDLTGESDTPSSAQSQSKGEIIINDGKLADDNEKGEKNKVIPREQDKVVHYAMQRAQNDNQFSNNIQDENFCAEKGRGLIVATVADQCEQYNSSRNAQADEVSTENFEKNGKHMVEEAAADVDHKIETGEHTSYENNKQMDQEDEKRSASAKQTLDQRNDTPSKSESVHLNQGDGKPTTPQTASSLAKSLQSSTQTENRNQENGTPSTSQMENPIQGDGKPSSSQTENSNQGDGKPSSSQVINPNQGNGKPTTQQTENQNKENGTPSTSLMDIPNQGNGIPSTSQAKNPNKGNGIPSTPQTENPNEGDGKPSLSQTENSNQGGGKLSSTQANDPNQGDGTPSSSQTENPKEGDGKPSLSQTENSNQGDGKLSSTQANDLIQGDGTPSSSQTENPNQGDGTPSLSQTENPNQGDGTPSTSQTKNLNQEDSIPSTSQTENLNQENGTPSTSQTMNPNQGDGKATTPQPKNSNQENGTPSIPQRENPNQGDGTPSISQTVSPNQEDSIPSISQTENPKQEDGIPSTSQTKNLNQGNGIPSVIGDRIHVNLDKGTSDNTEKGKNDRTSELDAGNLHKSDEDYRTTEEERQYAITKTQLSQSGIQVTEYANGQIEGGATCSEHSHIPFSFSQIQADFTIIEYQLEQVIDKILNDSTLHENKEEWKKNAKKEIMVFLLSIVKDGTLSRRSFHPCVTHSMPIQVFDSDIHVADPSIYTTKPHGNEKCQPVPSGQTASDSPGNMYSKSLYETNRKDAEKAVAGERLSISVQTRPKDALNPDKVVTSQPEPIKDCTDRTLPNTKDKEKMCKHNVFFVLDPGRKLKGEEWGLEIECASPEFYKLLFSFSNENLLSIAKEEFQRMKISLSQTFSQHMGLTCSCIKPCDQRKLDHLFIKAVVSVCYALLPFVRLTKVTIHPDSSFEQIKTFCFSRHDAVKKNTVHLFHNEERNNEVWIAVENDVRDLGSAVVSDLLNETKITEITQEWENYDLSGYFIQCAAFNEMDAFFLNLIKERYHDVNVSSDGKRAVFFGQKKIDGDLHEKIREEILALRKVRCSHAISPSLRILFTYQEAMDFINQTAHAKHSEPFVWTVTNQQGKTNVLEVYALNSSSANSALRIILGCLKQREFDDAQLHKEAFKFPVLEGIKFQGKIAYIEMKNKTVQIAGTEDIFQEFIDILINESIRLKKPVCKTVPVNSSNILSYCETHYQDHFREWKQSVDMEIIVGANGTCCYTIKDPYRNSKKVEEIANELKKIISDVQEIQFEEEENNIMDMSKTAEFRKQRCEIEKEWGVDTFVEGVPGQEWSVEDGFEWRFENGPSLTLLVLKSALPAETDVVLQPFRKDNIPVGKQQRNIQNPLSRDWHKLEFEAEYGDIGKAKESLRKSLKTTLLSDVKGNYFQTLVFCVEQKIMEKIGWSIKQYLKQILVVLQEDFISDPWSLYFLCGNKDELKICAEILETNFKKRNIFKTDVKIKSFPIEENVKPAITIEVRQGSLVQTKADVIVNTTNKDLKSLQQGRVSKSISDAAGSELSTECRKKYPKGIEYCEVAVTPSFQLKQCKKIYHGGIPFFNKSLTPLKNFVWNCLLQATRDNMQTIAFPAIGTGNLKYPKEGVAETMINTVHEFSDKCPATLQSVFIVIFDDATLQEFKKRSTAKQTASNTQTPGVSKKVKITVVGIPDRAEAASNCLHDFIKEFKKKKEDGTTRMQDEAIQSSESKQNKGLEKSITGKETTFPSKLGYERENVSVHGESLRLILVKTASESDSSLTMSECRKHLNGFQYKKLICPFENDYSALVKFETQKDVDQVLSNQKNANYAFKNLPEQAVHNVKAKLSKEIIHFLKTKDVTEEEIENASGASLDKIEWILTGHLLEIKQAAEFLKQIMSRDSEPRMLLDSTSLPNKVHEAHTTDVHEKKKMYCSISDGNAIRYFYQDVFSRLYCKQDQDGLRYLLIGKPAALDEFTHALDSIFKMTLNNINQVMYESAAKNKRVYCHFVEEKCTLEIFAETQERLEIIKTSLANFNKKGSGKANTFDKKQSELQDNEPITTGDDKNEENDVQLTMEADDYYTICHFYKEFSEKIKRCDKKDHIILTGPESLVKKIVIAQKDIKDNFFTEILVLDARVISRVHDVYTQMTETIKDVHVRIGKSGSNNIVLFTGLNKQEVFKMKAWFQDELDKKDKTSGKKPDEKKAHSPSSQKDCLIFQKGKCKVYSLEKDIFQVRAYAIVCPATLLVGNDIKEKAGLPENIIDNRADATSITDAPKLDTCTELIHINVPRWSDYGGKNNPCEDCIQDIGFVVERCLNVVSNCLSVAFPEFVSDKYCQLPALICCMGFAKGVQQYLNDHQKSDLDIYYVDNNPKTTNLLKRCFKQDVNWEYTADNEHSIFFLHCKFQVHVKKGDVFNAKAHAIAASQDADMKNERFVAKHLYKMNDTTYKLELKGKKLFTKPIITTAPRQCSYMKVIHFDSPNWRNLNSRRSEQLKKHFESIRTLLNFASREIASVVIPLSGGHFTDWETRKEIAKSTAKAVAEWCKENAKSSQKLETIYFLHDDSSYIKELIECCRQQPCLKEQFLVIPPTSTYSTPV